MTPEIEGSAKGRSGCITFVILGLVVVFAARFFSSLAIDYQWWKEMGQLETWFNTWLYNYTPATAAVLITFAVLMIAHARAMRHAGVRMRDYPGYGRLTAAGFFLLSLILAAAAIDTWAIVRYFGGRDVARGQEQWTDPVFLKPLGFYLFDLPFYSTLLTLVLVIVATATIVYWVASQFWTVRRTLSDWRQIQQVRFQLSLKDVLASAFVRGLAAVFLIALAVHFYLGRYQMLLNEHGFMVGIDYVNQYVGLPFQWIVIAACVLSAAAMIARQPAAAGILVAGALLLRAIVPAIVGAAYVRPNEISLEKPFIDRHIQATRSAYAIDQKTKEVQVSAKPEAPIDVPSNLALLNNVRLWDWRAFREAVSQIQPLRPYVYANVDVDRYMIGGKLRQLLLTPRELDLNGLADARARWINPHFIYTHGYGVVTAEANEITANGLPVLLIKDAPPEIATPDLKLTRPELYYSEIEHEPVFVRTAQPEFNYPAGEHNVQSRYDGKGGFPISSLLLRAAAAINQGDRNILLTGYLTPESRMMIHRRILDRLQTLAGYIEWDTDPYIVLGEDGRLVWIADGYMTSNAHPYSRPVDFEGLPELNYIRNSVKATIDAYDGTVHLYLFDEHDPLIRAYANLFPKLFEPAAAMPAGLRAHVRYPETIFRAQAEIYRIYHMRDPETFYNKSDAWDLAKFTSGQGSTPEPVTPTYLVASVPGSNQPEFLVMMPFTPRNRDNLIGLMLARCDGEHLGERIVLELPKQDIFLGPMQVEARFNQDQTISKDLTLWNQQGSQVLRGQMIVLPIGNTFLYIEPIYIQASQAKMPQLKKVVLALGNVLIYADTYQQALEQLAGNALPETVSGAKQPASSVAGRTAATPDSRLEQVREHFQRYRDLSAQGKWAEAGRELDTVQTLLAGGTAAKK